MQKADVLIVGAGAAGLMAAIQAARTDASRRVVVLDGAVRLGAKILIAGGGRCNVTHRAVDERDFNGSTPPAIRRILRAFDVPDTVAFFAARGVPMKTEATGKLFPESDRARDVLQALLDEATTAGVTLQHPSRVIGVAARTDGGFVVQTGIGTWHALTVVLATGGRSVPRTGSDGAGYAFATALGVPLTDEVFPALVPLLLPEGHLLRERSGLSADVRLTITTASGRHLRSTTGALLCTHLGISGPAVLDISRHWLASLAIDPATRLGVSWLPDVTPEALDRILIEGGGASVRRALSPPLPERLAQAVCLMAGVSPDQRAATLPRELRGRLVSTTCAGALPVVGTRGFAAAEVTAGGIPLAALTPVLEARACPGLFVCGEICDVDGRIGGFNFQWAWASGTVAGRAAARRSAEIAPEPVAGSEGSRL